MITVNDTYCIFESCKKVDLKSSNHKKSVQLCEVMDVNSVVVSLCVCMIIMLFTLKLYNIIYQLYLDETKIKKKFLKTK